MLNLRPILFVTGILLAILAVTMIIPALVDAYTGHSDWKSFAISSFITAFVGLNLYYTNRTDTANLTIRDTFFMTVFIWLVITAFSAMPFVFSDREMSFTDSFFEAMSGLTTTGSTVITGLDYAPPGLLLWRALLNTLGGIGIIVMAIAILPMLKIGGMQLFRAESSDKYDKILPRAAQISTAITVVYVLLTLLCSICFWAVGMNFFDAICHAMTTIATGGFSNYDTSIGYYDDPKIEMTVAFFMFTGGIPFILYFQLIRGRYRTLWQDSQVRWYTAITAFSIIVVTLWLSLNERLPFWEALRHTAFNVISIITTTGFTSTDYTAWGSFPATYIFLLTVMGSCTGSTSGGIKIFRYQIFYLNAKAQLQHLLQPHGIFRPQYNGKPLSETVTGSVMNFFVLFAFCFVIICLLLSWTGLDFVTSVSGAAQVLANVGPGLGHIIGPTGNFATLPEASKWVLSFAMMLGRLELFTVLVLFTPYFWKG